MTEDEAKEYTDTLIKKHKEDAKGPTEEEIAEYTTKILERHKIQARPLTSKDYAEIKKWIRISNLFPNKAHRYIPKFRIFHDRYCYIIYAMDEKTRAKLWRDMRVELKVEPCNDKDYEFVAKGVIETIKRRSKEE